MILDTIVAATRLRVAQAQANVSLDQVKQQALALVALEQAYVAQAPFLPFEANLRNPGLSLICEVKKASPSKGIISPTFPYLDIALAYAECGAAAISVLTEPDFFLGNDAILCDVRKTVTTPILRKDFTIDPYQIYEAKCLGANAILLIVAILSDEELQSFHALASSLNLSVLVECHDKEEIERALKCGGRIIGVNNRNLKDFSVNFKNATQLRALVPKELLFVAESGIQTIDDIRFLQSAGIDAALVGEALMRADDLPGTLQAWVQAGASSAESTSSVESTISLENAATASLTDTVGASVGSFCEKES